MEAEIEAFQRKGLEFRLSERLLREAEVAVFIGHLRLQGSDRRTFAMVIYPPGYHAGEHPAVLAPALEVGRHRAPGGTLCLDHPTLEGRAPMSGAEAVLRAERLWWLWENDRVQLTREEADVAEPWSIYVHNTQGSAVALVDLVVPAKAQSGVVELRATSLNPLRGSVRGLEVLAPSATRVEAGPAHEVFAGDIELSGPWKRLDKPPTFTDEAKACDWLMRRHSEMLAEAARELRGSDSETPYLLAFTYPDEGPRRGETHDAWLFVAIRPGGGVELPRPIYMSREGTWLRQPELKILGDKRVAVVGIGALGSQIAGLLARAGVGGFILVDSDLYLPDNRARHDLDLGAIGHDKVDAEAERIRRLNPWAKIERCTARLGTLSLGVDLEELQVTADRLVEQLASADLIINATADPNAASYISGIAAETRTPVVHTWVSAGAWGGRVLVQSPGASACTDCLGAWQAAGTRGRVPPLSQPRKWAVLDAGCGEVTFTGPGFELASAAAAAARVATQELLHGQGYPPRTFDLATLTFRQLNRAVPSTTYTRLPPHPGCSTCGAAMKIATF